MLASLTRSLNSDRNDRIQEEWASKARRDWRASGGASAIAPHGALLIRAPEAPLHLTILSHKGVEIRTLL